MTRLAAALVVTLITLAPVAQAQFSMPSLPGVGGKAAGSGDLSGSQDALVKQYVDANKTVLQANAQIADAVGLKDEAATMRASSESLTDGATKGNLADADKVTSENSKKLTAKLNDSTTVLDAEGKKKFTAGLVTMASGMVKYVAMKPNFQSFSSSLKGASPMMLPKLQNGVYVVSSLPGNAKNLGSALSNAVSFAKSHDITVPKEATSALGAGF
ncbi:hypothetical protein [Massilia sp. S19_KUP03_FR1]|uniref:hypothetical protein n=1 Tax=Massilia sp. S19_KUP03_FR1 TaxID=3025503 RepID=UPI002FCDAFE8